MPLSLAYEILYYQSVALEVAPRLKNREINELEKTEIESLRRFCHTFDYEKVEEEERQFSAFCFVLVLCLLKEVKVGSLCCIICPFLNLCSLHQAM